MSARDRARRKDKTALEIQKQALETGQGLHKTIAVGLGESHKLTRFDILAADYIAAVPELLASCNKADREALLEAQGKFERVIQAIQAIAELPKQAPKKRDQVAALYFEAQAQFAAVSESLNR